MAKMPVGCGDGPGHSTRAVAASQLNCVICGLPVDPGLGGISIDGEWVHWNPCVAEFERARRYGDRPLLPKDRVLELFAQARAAGRLQP